MVSLLRPCPPAAYRSGWLGSEQLTLRRQRHKVRLLATICQARSATGLYRTWPGRAGRCASHGGANTPLQKPEAAARWSGSDLDSMFVFFCHVH